MHPTRVNYTSRQRLTIQTKNHQDHRDHDIELRNFENLFEQVEKAYETQYVTNMVKYIVNTLELQEFQIMLYDLVERASLTRNLHTMSHSPYSSFLDSGNKNPLKVSY